MSLLLLKKRNRSSSDDRTNRTSRISVTLYLLAKGVVRAKQLLSGELTTLKERLSKRASDRSGLPRRLTLVLYCGRKPNRTRLLRDRNHLMPSYNGVKSPTACGVKLIHGSVEGDDWSHQN